MIRNGTLIKYGSVNRANSYQVHYSSVTIEYTLV